MQPRNGTTAGIASENQIANRISANVVNTGYVSPGVSIPGVSSPMPPAAQGQNTAAGALVQSGRSSPSSWRSGFKFGRGSPSSPRRKKNRAAPTRAARRPKRKAAATRTAKRARPKKARLVRGSAAAKRYMAKIRRMRKRR